MIEEFTQIDIHIAHETRNRLSSVTSLCIPLIAYRSAVETRTIGSLHASATVRTSGSVRRWFPLTRSFFLAFFTTRS